MSVRLLTIFYNAWKKYVEDTKSSFFFHLPAKMYLLSLAELWELPKPLPLPSSVRPSCQQVSDWFIVNIRVFHSSSWTLKQLKITPASLCAICGTSWKPSDANFDVAQLQIKSIEFGYRELFMDTGEVLRKAMYDISIEGRLYVVAKTFLIRVVNSFFFAYVFYIIRVMWVTAGVAAIYHFRAANSKSDNLSSFQRKKPK